jgi:adenosylmethionine-8-amino-7-oxononanoate aminotransferase
VGQARHPRDAGVTAPDWLTQGWQHIWLPYAQMKTAPLPLPVVGASGSRLHLADGRELVDGVASWWTVAHGYNHPHMREVIGEQLLRLPHVMLGGLAHEQAYTLATRLSGLLPPGLDRTFFSDSGSVAVEVALKMAIQFWVNQGNRQRRRIVHFRGSYHGDTFATMSLCDPDEGMHALFSGMLADNPIADLPVSERAKERLDEILAQPDIAAVIVEPLVQGAGGMLFHPPSTLKSIADSARRHGVLLILDEIFTGFARTGTMFACEQADIVPDIICLGKALTGGALPLAATVATSKVFDAFLDDDPAKALMHGPTYMGNALACAAANASLDLFASEPRTAQAQAIGQHLEQALTPLRQVPGVVDVRVKGAIGVVELKTFDRLALRRKFIERGVWIRPFGRIVYTTPSLTIGPEDLSRLTRAIVDVVSETAA